MELTLSPTLRKLVWSEGMYLAPHHFQAQSRFFEGSTNFLAECFRQFGFGFLRLEIGGEELRHGYFQLHHLSGVMPDGLAFELSRPEDLPPGRAIAELFPDTGHPLPLFLAVRSFREGQRNVAQEAPVNGRAPARFRTSVSVMTDFNTGQGAKPVTLLKPDFRVVTDHEVDAADIVLPLARILRDGKGQFVPDPQYIPPCLNVASSARLQSLLDRLLGILAIKSRDLSARRRSGHDSRGGQRELVEFWLLHTVNSAIPLLRQWKAGRSPHPMQLYLGLASLAGALCTFASGSDPADVPVYDHSALGECFGFLDQHIQRHLELGLPENCLTIPLPAFQPLFHGAAIADPRCFSPSRWVLAIKADGPETALISQVPSRVKISAREWIERVVRQAVPGAPLTYLPVPPASIPSRFGVICFSIDCGHPLFDPVRKNRSVGVYVPGEFLNVELELHIVIDDTNGGESNRIETGK